MLIERGKNVPRPLPIPIPVLRRPAREALAAAAARIRANDVGIRVLRAPPFFRGEMEGIERAVDCFFLRSSQAKKKRK